MLSNCVGADFLSVPWTARRPNQSILKEISPEHSLEGLMLKLKLQFLGHLMRRADSLEKTPRLQAGGEGDDRGWDGWMASPTPWTWVWVNSRSWWWTGRPGVLQSMGHKELDMTERLNWTELISSALGICWAGWKLLLVTIKGDMKSVTKPSGFNHASQNERCSKIGYFSRVHFGTWEI